MSTIIIVQVQYLEEPFGTYGLYMSTTILQGETELSFRLIPSLTQSHTKPRTETVREEAILAKEGISLEDNSVSPRSTSALP